MSGIDARGCSISGATPAALAAYERAIGAFQSWRSGAEVHLEVALAHRLGGSHAQRDVLHLTVLRAVERIRRPVSHQLSLQQRQHPHPDRHAERA